MCTEGYPRHLTEYSRFSNKWEFEQMGALVENRLLFIREQMGVLIDEKFESKQYRTSSKNAETGHHFASFKNFYAFSKMGIRTNESFEIKSLQFGVKWDPFDRECTVLLEPSVIFHEKIPP